MKFGILFILFFALNISLAQKAKKVRSSNHNVQIYFNADSVQKKALDSFFAKSKDSLAINLSKLQKQDLKVIFETPPDNLKYYIPILTLILGIGISQLIEFIKKRVETNRQGRKWVLELKSIDNSFKNQNSEIDSFLGEFGKEEWGLPALVHVQKLNCKVFEKLDDNDFINYLNRSKKKKLDTSIEIASDVDMFIERVSKNDENFLKELETYKTNISAYTKELGIELNKFLAAFTELNNKIVEEVKGDPRQNKEFRALHSLVESEITPFQDNGKYDIYRLQKSFIITANHSLSGTGSDVRFKDVSTLIAAIDLVIKKMKGEKSYLETNFKTIKSRYEEYTSDLKDILKDIGKDW